MLLDQLLFSKHLERGEKILFSVHRHWIQFLKPALTLGFFGIATPWLLYLIGFRAHLFFWIAVIWSASGYAIFMLELCYWYGEVILVTSAGLLKVEWKGAFNNLATRVLYEDLEGATYEIKGFWGTVLQYGRFSLHLAGGTALTIHQAGDPKRAEIQVMQLQQKYMHQKELNDAAGLKALLSEIAIQELRKKS